MEAAGHFVIDDRSSGGLDAGSGHSWRLITDAVMGGKSRASLTVGTLCGRPCLRLAGDVSTANNGGFVQAALDLGDGGLDAMAYHGVELLALGNGRRYNIHIRTPACRAPWQSYRAAFDTGPEWRRIRLPFAKFAGYRLDAPIDPQRLTRLGLVAIGAEFKADVALAELAFYRQPPTVH